MKLVTPQDRLAVALDVPTLEGARMLVRALTGRVGVFKVGLEQFVAHGPAAVEVAAAGGAGVFLDLKVHDIPRTAAAAVRSAAALGARLVTLHALGGPAMIAAAREAAESVGASRPWLLAVTVLTSHDAAELDRIGLPPRPEQEVLRLARMAIAAGADGLVASALEARALREALGPEPLLVTPGIRPAGADAGDQARVATAGDAIRAGASILVVGRPIVKAADPAAAADRLVEEIAAARS
ncbi:MAG: orotidine-5'-phosphate decarboxylase [Acidobacteria bacterium]|nr:orotidine-5'-phosphate decarboxylase [Acidobacteriota bacterium]